MLKRRAKLQLFYPKINKLRMSVKLGLAYELWKYWVEIRESSIS